MFCHWKGNILYHLPALQIHMKDFLSELYAVANGSFFSTFYSLDPFKLKIWVLIQINLQYLCSVFNNGGFLENLMILKHSTIFIFYKV